MNVQGKCAVVTGGASGLGRAAAQRLHEAGARVAILDLPSSDGAAVAATLGDGALFVPADVTRAETLDGALDAAAELGDPRILVHCAGRGGPMRLLNRQGEPGSVDLFRSVIDVNVIGTFNVLRLVAARMATAEPLDDERGVCVLTASVAAFEGQIGQIAYGSSKAAIAGMTIIAARDLASRLIRVCTIAPGTFDTPLLGRLPDDVRAGLAAAVPHPSRLGDPAEYAELALHIVQNAMLNGETIRLDGAIRMPPR